MCIWKVTCKIIVILQKNCGKKNFIWTFSLWLKNWLIRFQVNSILRHVAELLGYSYDSQLEELYEKTAWHFDEKYKKPGASYEAFKHAVRLVWRSLIDIILFPSITGNFQPQKYSEVLFFRNDEAELSKKCFFP